MLACEMASLEDTGHMSEEGDSQREPWECSCSPDTGCRSATSRRGLPGRSEWTRAETPREGSGLQEQDRFTSGTNRFPNQSTQRVW